LHLAPHAARAAEIGDAGFGADAGAAEDENAPAVEKQFRERGH
jgi:hypothetical protein